MSMSGHFHFDEKASAKAKVRLNEYGINISFSDSDEILCNDVYVHGTIDQIEALGKSIIEGVNKLRPQIVEQLCSSDGTVLQEKDDDGKWIDV